MRINKFLADKGIASRRHADEIIAAGRVTINGVVATLGANVDEGDEVALDGIVLETTEKKMEYYLMNKPKGVVCTVSDDRGRKTVIDLLPEGVGRVFPVGRLDYETEGLLILTNDGDLAYRLTHPMTEIPKTYMAKIEGTLTEKDLNPIRSGIELDGVMTKKCKAHIVETNKAYTKVHITITEGKNRQVRRMFEAIGRNVELLRRVSIGQLKLTGLDRGKTRPLTCACARVGKRARWKALAVAGAMPWSSVPISRSPMRSTRTAKNPFCCWTIPSSTSTTNVSPPRAHCWRSLQATIRSCTSSATRIAFRGMIFVRPF